MADATNGLVLMAPGATLPGGPTDKNSLAVEATGDQRETKRDTPDSIKDAKPVIEAKKTEAPKPTPAPSAK